jgi:hypothetical protein
LAYHPVDGQIITCPCNRAELDVIKEHHLAVAPCNDAGGEDEDQVEVTRKTDA